MQSEAEFHAAIDGSTVFVVEAEQVVRSAVHYILRDHFRTRVFASLSEAAASAGDVPDVLVLGSSILQRQGPADLAALVEQYAGARILLIVERNDDPLAQAVLERGAHGIISKPISFDSIYDAVSAALAAPAFSDKPSLRLALG